MTQFTLYQYLQYLTIREREASLAQAYLLDFPLIKNIHTFSLLNKI